MVAPLGQAEFSHASLQTARGTLRIAESFTSRQGEGKLTGTDSFFIRTSGCNLRCWFCDTPYASWDATGEKQSIESLVEAAGRAGHAHVVLTGGEPLLPTAGEALSKTLMESGFHLTIETAGTIDKPISCDLLSLSPKLASSAPDANDHPRWNRLHQERRLPLPTMRKLIAAAKDFQLKFVVSGDFQFDEVQSVVRSLAVENKDVFIMPQGITIEDMNNAEKWLRPWSESAGYQYCDRMQIRWFGNRRGT